MKDFNLKISNVPKEFSDIFEENNVDFEIFEEINEINQLNCMRKSGEIDETEYYERSNLVREENQREKIRQSESFIDRNYIKKSDLEDIKLSAINHLELAKYQDGNYTNQRIAVSSTSYHHEVYSSYHIMWYTL